ncbi:MAG: carboxypeptidase regulatory-like domain-containing protein [Acidobacteria bacterium]|nr:carboxypeptidase regulatory-like domain-containing protein [Acidobacteriota bacterium]
MQWSRFLNRALAVAFAVVLLSAAAAHGQGRIAGRVTDNTGGVLPGVTVEARSPVLIEGSRVAITDGQGRYGIVDLRPGTYEVAFTLPGFSTVVRDGLELPASFAMTIAVEMRVGALAETITVSGRAPIVDAQQAPRTQVIPREVIDAVPTGRSWQTRVALMPGVRTTLDIGGSHAMDQHALRTAGLDDKNTTVLIDGMLLNNLSSDGASQYYLNDAFTHEMAVQTSGPDAETSAGGVRVTMIPREGGNAFSGTFYYEAMNREFASSNLTSRLRDQGVASVDRIDRAYEVNGSFGGPVVRDRLWFFYSGHRRIRDRVVLDSFYRDGSPGIDDRQVHGNNLRLTIQGTPRDKFSAWYDRNNKVTGHNHVVGEDVETASTNRGIGRHPPRYAAQAKWTSTISTRLLSEIGFGTNRVDYRNGPQPGLRKGRPAGFRSCVATPCLEFDPAQSGDVDLWYEVVSRFDPEAVGIERSGNSELDFGKTTQRYVLSAKLSYVTGSHNFRVGVQNSFGPEIWTWSNNADIRSQDYRAGAPEEILISNTPVTYSHRLNRDLGLYAQDSWTLDRLTLSPGIRVEWFNGQVDASSSAAGRWVPARRFDEITNLPDWFDVSPRLGVAYDLSGDAGTALKFSVGRYMDAMTVGFTSNYNPLSVDWEYRDWQDCYRDGPGGNSCSGADPYATNGDDIVQDWEVGPGQTDFGARRTNHPDPDIQRPYHLRTHVSIDHRVTSWLGVTAGWSHSVSRLLFTTNNVLRTLSDYDAVQVANPLSGYEGEMVAVYNLHADKRGDVDNLDTNTTSNRDIYTGFEFSFDARVPGGGNLLGGIDFGRETFNRCDSPFDPNTFRFCDTTGGDGEARALARMPDPLPGSGLRGSPPYLAAFKLAGNYQLPLHLVASFVVRSLPGEERSILWSVPRTAFDEVGGRTQSVRVRLNPPGSIYNERINVLDLSFGRLIDVGGARVRVGADIYNVLNPDTILRRRDNYGASLGNVSEVILGRFWKFLTQVSF